MSDVGVSRRFAAMQYQARESAAIPPFTSQMMKDTIMTLPLLVRCRSHDNVTNILAKLPIASIWLNAG